MRILKFQGKLLMGVLAALACAAPLACSSDEAANTGGSEAGEGGEAGMAGSVASAGQGGDAVSDAGAPGDEVGGDTGVGGLQGAAGTPVVVGGSGGSGGGTGGSGTGGSGTGGGEASGGGDGNRGSFDQYVDKACTTEASLDCDPEMSASDEKEGCVEGFGFYLDSFPNCGDQFTALANCLSLKPASSFSCQRGTASPNDGVCDAENADVGTCVSQ